MSWEQKLYETYEKNIKIDQTKGTEKTKLTPVSHLQIKAQVEITINRDGEFLKADVIGDDAQWTLIPVTDASATSRSSGIAPHSLCDTLVYIAGDFSKYGGKYKTDKTGKTSFDIFLAQLSKWAAWEKAHEKVQIIYRYISKKSITEDLIKSKILKTDSDGFLTKDKVGGQPPERVFVRFKVIDGSSEERTWEDTELILNYLDYCSLNVNHDLHLDLIQGVVLPTHDLHPRGILPGEYGAKLISSSDKSNYTYRGRFMTPEQVANLGYETSQKIHAALIWLLKNQGVAIGNSGRYYLYWSPNPDTAIGVLGNEIIKGPTVHDQNRVTLLNWLVNKKAELSIGEEIIVIGLEAPTPGQLSIVEYHEFNAKEFLDNLIYWQKTCNWFYWENGKMVVDSPSLFQLTNDIYGVERDEWFEVDDKLFRDSVTRLQTCMINKSPLPYDIVKTITDKASTLYKFKNFNRNRVLSTACAVIKKYNIDHNKGEIKMVLDKTNTDRNYLFGRLLAVYERVETVASAGDDHGRETNAIKLQTAFVQHPGSTWKVLENQIAPYLSKLSGGARENFRKLITEIVMLFNEKEFDANIALNENYLLGYYLQRAEFYKKKQEEILLETGED